MGRYCSSWIICIKGSVFRLSHDCHFDIDSRDVSTELGRVLQVSLGDSVDLLSRTICTTMVVRDWCIANLFHGWRFVVQITLL